VRSLSIVLIMLLALVVIGYQTYMFAEMFTNVQVLAEPNIVR